MIRYCLFLLMLISSLSRADTLDKFIESLQEQEVVVGWIQTLTKERVTVLVTSQVVKDIYIHSLSKDIDPKLAVALVQTESGFKSKAKSSYGAVGLFQVVPRFHKEKIKNRNPYIDKVSIEVGTTVLKDCMNLHNNNVFKSLDCYSGGGGLKYFNKVTKYRHALIKEITPVYEVAHSDH
jgi:soluble lytic murein transglycosylase-like protein